ncbi:hypothetical protein HMN09_00829000 [Mycena chlorophos]|uniref:Uncharacterized protein n=1 Tax=Mycena chlorophos TaxID=658473 RepID=A0A8H6W649_MYCCL|nr:hypothetical protein HMN09_00829000 [Mycena chlorophos]
MSPTRVNPKLSALKNLSRLFKKKASEPQKEQMALSGLTSLGGVSVQVVGDVPDQIGSRTVEFAAAEVAVAAGEESPAELAGTIPAFGHPASVNVEDVALEQTNESVLSEVEEENTTSYDVEEDSRAQVEFAKNSIPFPCVSVADMSDATPRLVHQPIPASTCLFSSLNEPIVSTAAVAALPTLLTVTGFTELASDQAPSIPELSIEPDFSEMFANIQFLREADVNAAVAQLQEENVVLRELNDVLNAKIDALNERVTILEGLMTNPTTTTAAPAVAPLPPPAPQIVVTAPTPVLASVPKQEPASGNPTTPARPAGITLDALLAAAAKLKPPTRAAPEAPANPEAAFLNELGSRMPARIPSEESRKNVATALKFGLVAAAAAVPNTTNNSISCATMPATSTDPFSIRTSQADEAPSVPPTFTLRSLASIGSRLRLSRSRSPQSDHSRSQTSLATTRSSVSVANISGPYLLGSVRSRELPKTATEATTTTTTTTKQTMRKVFAPIGKPPPFPQTHPSVPARSEPEAFRGGQARLVGRKCESGAASQTTMPHK